MWFQFPLEEIKYLIFSFHRCGIEALSSQPAEFGGKWRAESHNTTENPLPTLIQREWNSQPQTYVYFNKKPVFHNYNRTSDNVRVTASLAALISQRNEALNSKSSL